MKTLIYIMITVALFNAVNICFAEEEKDDVAEMIVKSNTDFAFDLYTQLKDAEGNLFFSPYSISTAMAMTYAGAKGETEKQIAKTLHFPVVPYFDSDPFQRGYCNLIKQLNAQGQKGDYQLLIANALWAQKDYPFRNIPEGFESFLGWAKNGYKAGLENVDFVNETEKSRQKINRWVEDKTNDKIKNLIPKGALNALTRLVLTNAIYFKGDWAEQFDKDDTQDEDFFVSADKTVKAPLMYQKEDFKYGQTDTLQLLELPYKGDDLSMLILLPRRLDSEGNAIPSTLPSIEVIRGRNQETLKPKTTSFSLSKVEDQLTAENLAEWQKKMRKQEVEVFLPKFKMTSQFGLSETLAKMGMPDAFDSLKADFSGMTGNKDLFISAVLHKAFVEVNEEGTEAAAATGVMMELSMALEGPVFRADHPFVFVIKDNNTKSILFVGRVADPTKMTLRLSCRT
ncbi:MAG: serpin family protein [Planctomycetota bacterium]